VAITSQAQEATAASARNFGGQKLTSEKRRAVDMLVLHFGEIRPHESGDGTVGDYALHIQGPWRLDGPGGTITGRDDLWEYVGPGEEPPEWSYEDGHSLQDERFDDLLGPREEATHSWVNEADRLVVTAAQHTNRGDVRIELTGGYVILLFPDGSRREAWRLFAPGSSSHLVFPDESWHLNRTKYRCSFERDHHRSDRVLRAAVGADAAEPICAETIESRG
jgi:hypothetical protein